MYRGICPLWGSEFTTKAATIQEGESKELILGPFVMFFNPVFPACMVHEFYGLKSSPSGLQRRSRRERGRRDLVVKHVFAVELRVVVTAVLAVAADVMLIAHLHLKLGAIWLPHWPVCR